MLVDAHSHIFPQVRGLIGAGPTRSLGYGRIAIGAEETQLFPPYGEKTAFTPEMLVANLDWAGVERAVLLQGTFYGECNQYVVEALERYPERLIGAAWLDPWAPRSRAQFGRIIAHPGFRALKLECSEATGLCGLHPEARLDAPELAWLWEEVAAAGWTLVLDLGAVGSRSYQTSAVRAIAQVHPELRIVIAHLGQPRPQVQQGGGGIVGHACVAVRGTGDHALEQAQHAAHAGHAIGGGHELHLRGAGIGEADVDAAIHQRA